MARPRRHEYVELPGYADCARCNLPRKNRVHQLIPRLFAVRVTAAAPLFPLEEPFEATEVIFGPFGDEDEAEDFARTKRVTTRVSTSVIPLKTPA